MKWLALIGWIAILSAGGYIALSGAAMAALTGGFRGRASSLAILASLCGVAIIIAAFLIAPFHIAWSF